VAEASILVLAGVVQANILAQGQTTNSFVATDRSSDKVNDF